MHYHRLIALVLLVNGALLARHLEAKSVDDTLELLDLLMTTELLGKAHTAADKEKVRKHPRLARASARLAVAGEALFESDGWGGPDEEPRVSAVWEAVEAVVSRSELRAALVLVNESVPPADAADADNWRAELAGRYTGPGRIWTAVGVKGGPACGWPDSGRREPPPVPADARLPAIT